MAKVPSQWTPQEAWARGQYKLYIALKRDGYDMLRQSTPFPADPPEVVSEEYLQSIADGEVGSVCKQNAMRMAAELLARREAERKA